MRLCIVLGQRVDFSLFRDLLGRTTSEQALQGGGIPRELVDIQRSLLTGCRTMLPSEQETGKRRHDAHIDCNSVLSRKYIGDGSSVRPLGMDIESLSDEEVEGPSGINSGQGCQRQQYKCLQIHQQSKEN